MSPTCYAPVVVSSRPKREGGDCAVSGLERFDKAELEGDGS
jgi:hypothetical protein